MKLTATNVENVFEKCTTNNTKSEDAIAIRGVAHGFWLSKTKLNEHKEDICSMLDDLPEEFRSDKGGGWSFLQACITKDGQHWGEHLHMELLFVLGMGIGKVKELLPRKMWKALPGGVPYYVIETDKAANNTKVVEDKDDSSMYSSRMVSMDMFGKPIA